jgi:membrane associated rhomboid family serine protease
VNPHGAGRYSPLDTIGCHVASTEQAMVCYRHPGRETAVTCSNCERPICPDCMVFAAVGIKCPECAGQPIGIKKATKRARAAAGTGTDALVTKALIGTNVFVFLLQISQGDIRGNSGTVFQEGVLWLPALAFDNEWWRLVTSGFLHYGLLHILFNMVMLWWFGSPLELLLGRARFLALYFLGILGGAAGALLLAPGRPTVGASAGVFAILGAGLVLERRGINVFGGAALMVVLLNVVLSFAIAQISLGGHLGGLAAGMLAILAMTQFGRGHAAYGRLGLVGVASLAGIAVGELMIAYLRVRGYT